MTREELIREGWIPVPGSPDAFYMRTEDAYNKFKQKKLNDSILHANEEEFEKFLQGEF